MALYEHSCEHCGLVTDLICPMAERDQPKPCSEHVLPGERTSKDGGKATCDGKGTLKRTGEIEVTAHTPYGWKP